MKNKMKKILKLITDAVDRKVFPGCAVAIVSPTEEIELAAAGHYTYIPAPNM